MYSGHGYLSADVVTLYSWWKLLTITLVTTEPLIVLISGLGFFSVQMLDMVAEEETPLLALHFVHLLVQK